MIYLYAVLFKSYFFFIDLIITMIPILANIFQKSWIFPGFEFQSILKVESASICICELALQSLHFLKASKITHLQAFHVWILLLKTILFLLFILCVFHFFHLCRKSFSNYQGIVFPFLQSFHKVCPKKLRQSRQLQFWLQVDFLQK